MFAFFLLQIITVIWKLLSVLTNTIYMFFFSFWGISVVIVSTDKKKSHTQNTVENESLVTWLFLLLAKINYQIYLSVIWIEIKSMIFIFSSSKT